MSAGDRVGAVVVNYNGSAATRICVDSLLGSSESSLFVVIADNASEPSDLEILEQAYGDTPGVEILALPENRHFAGGVNAGAARALALGATHLFVLNNDTEIEPDCVRRLLEVSQQNSSAGIVGPELLDLGDRRPLSLGERYSPWSLAFPRTLLKVRSVGSGRPYRVGGVMGSAVLITRACFERVGAYDESLLVYYEEVDFCLRARARGYQPMIAPGAVVLHDGMRGFTAGLTPYAARLKVRNVLRLMRTHAGPAAWLPFTPIYIGLLVGSAVVYFLRGQWSVVRALGQGLREGLMRDAGSGP